MTSIGKLLNTRVLELIKIHIWYIGHFCVWERVGKLWSQSPESHTNFIKLYVTSVDLELHLRNALSNVKMSYVSNVDLDKWNKLAIHDFSSWGRLWFRKPTWSCENLKSQNLIGANFVFMNVVAETIYGPIKVSIRNIQGLTWSNVVKLDTK